MKIRRVAEAMWQTVDFSLSTGHKTSYLCNGTVAAVVGSVGVGVYELCFLT